MSTDPVGLCRTGDTNPPSAALMGMDATIAMRNGRARFEINIGWAPPDEDEWAEWLSEGVWTCADELSLLVPRAGARMVSLRGGWYVAPWTPSVDVTVPTIGGAPS